MKVLFLLKPCRAFFVWLMLFLMLGNIQAQESTKSPLKWFSDNWVGYDSAYSVSAFYNWTFMLQNTSSQEWLTMSSSDGMHVDMRSNLSNYFGPYFGYRWLIYGYTVDLSSLGKPSKRKNEFTLSINSNLVNVDLIYRRTGGDFNIRDLYFDSPELGKIDMTDFAQEYDLGDYVKNNLTGVNISYFLNHRRYSNPAAFSNGAIQFRSAGSPIVGLGYTHQKIESDVSHIFTSGALQMMAVNMLANPSAWDYLNEFADKDFDAMSDEEVEKEALKFIDNGWEYMKDDNSFDHMTRAFLLNQIPTVTRIDDWHLQFGYAYNHVFSRRLLLGVSAVAAPGLKRIQTNNEGSVAYDYAEDFSRLLKKYEGVDRSPEDFRIKYDKTDFNLNFFMRASLTFNYNHWLAGINASFSNYHYRHHGLTVKNTFGSVSLYVGYLFGLKKEFRRGGDLRRKFIETALPTYRQQELSEEFLPIGK